MHTVAVCLGELQGEEIYPEEAGVGPPGHGVLRQPAPVTRARPLRVVDVGQLGRAPPAHAGHVHAAHAARLTRKINNIYMK